MAPEVNRLKIMAPTKVDWAPPDIDSASSLASISA